jgi:hypothetical protein
MCEFEPTFNLNPLLTWPPHLDAAINATAATVAAEAVPRKMAAGFNLANKPDSAILQNCWARPS